MGTTAVNPFSITFPLALRVCCDYRSNLYIKEKEISLTDSTSQIEVVTLALYLQGGDTKAVDTEDVAIKAHELAPGRFSWRKYPDQINLELVRVYLSAAKDPTRGGGFIEGTGRSGWTLTPAGLAWAKKAAGKLEGKNLQRPRKDRLSGSIDEVRWQRERARVTNTRAWVRWLGNRKAPIPQREAAEVFRIDTYAVGRTRDLKIARARQLFEEDPEVGPFIEAAAAVMESKGEVDV